MDFAKLLLAVAPHGKAAIREGFAAAMPQVIAVANLNTPLRLAHFLAQCAHESAGLATTVEYASGKAYEGRKDLGNVQSGDGVRYRGRGLIQITGRQNFRAAGDALGLPLENRPALAAEFPAAALTAAWFWASHNLNKFADADDIEGVTRRVNGGLNGIASRKAYLAKAKAALGDLKGALMAGAAEQAAAAKSKAKAATGAVGVGSISPVAAQAATGAPEQWALVLIGAGMIGLGIAIFLSTRKHQDAAGALTAAAKEA